jgi:hypothetical protein
MDLRRVSRLVAGILLVGVAVFFLLRVGGTEEPPVAAPDPAVTSPSVPKTDLPPKKDPGCAGGTDAEFRPASITVPGVVRRAEVLALPRDDRNVPGVPPLSDKASFAWDDGGIRPGSAQGNVLMNTHTWPDGSATGNLLLEHLEVGDRIVLRGEGEKLCYEITERIEVLAADGYPPYYDVDGPPQLALVVCSGERRGLNDWSHRTIWFAAPVT